MEFMNVYADDRKAAAYAAMEFPGTYLLAFRDLPALLAEHVRGREALDLGCGTGRSTRFLARHGFDAFGVDIAAEMVRLARAADPDGEYLLDTSRDLAVLGDRRFDLVLAAFTFDNIPMDEKPPLLRRIAARLRPDGVLVMIVSTPELYLHEWASFSTRDFPANRVARTGDVVRDVITDIDDPRPCLDILCPDEEYRRLLLAAGLRVVAAHRPLATGAEPIPWVSETRIPPWTVYVVTRHHRVAHANPGR